MTPPEVEITAHRHYGASWEDLTDTATYKSGCYNWTDEDVMSMPLYAFKIWWDGPVVRAVLSGNKMCRTPADQGEKKLVGAAIERAMLEGIHVPPPAPPPPPCEPQFVRIDGKRLREAMRRRAHGMKRLAIAREANLDVYTVKLLMMAERRIVRPRTLASICKWLGLEPEEFMR